MQQCIADNGGAAFDVVRINLALGAGLSMCGISDYYEKCSSKNSFQPVDVSNLACKKFHGSDSVVNDK